MKEVEGKRKFRGSEEGQDTDWELVVHLYCLYFPWDCQTAGAFAITQTDSVGLGFASGASPSWIVSLWIPSLNRSHHLQTSCTFALGIHSASQRGLCLLPPNHAYSPWGCFPFGQVTVFPQHSYFVPYFSKHIFFDIVKISFILGYKKNSELVNASSVSLFYIWLSCVIHTKTIPYWRLIEDLLTDATWGRRKWPYSTVHC